MPTTIKAIFAHGVFEPLDDIELQDGMEVNITIENIEDSHAYFWTKEWQEKEREADEALTNGEYVEFDNAETAYKWLRGQESEKWLKNLNSQNAL
ncbi:antitoxin family protein [Candidatus Magnetobacterium casense]|uniref:Antitoxin family protein n=1 Tax=Candidatus Magnetobacterium casense TaxID=1455061 RepID=A0ABS6S1A8_9BACT|nr:antitoxin family protein [Candidatus Magnetobacterium casensis]MBV6342635.1 antitoxin family protein [Candidatus Magnetobacterium casensis]